MALHFLAGWLGAGGLVSKVQDGLEKVRRPVEKGIDKVLDKVAEKAGPVWARMQAGVGKLVDKGKAMVSGAVGKVKGWFSLRQKFTLADGEAHTIYFNEQGQLMLASSPTPYLLFLSKFEKEHPGAVAARDQLSKQHDVWNLVGQIKPLGLDRTRLEAQQSRQQQTTPNWTPNTNPALTLQLDQNAKAINDLLLLLAAETVKLLQRTATGAVTTASPPKYNGFSKGGFATGMRVEYLAQKGWAGGSETSGIPTGEGQLKFGILAKRLNTGKQAYYRMGHLLNAHLGGPGNKWENLTPLSSSGNALHNTRVEKPLKDERDQALSSNTPRAFLYSVVPQYAHPFRQDLHKQALDEAAAAVASPTTEKHFRLVAEIIEAEQYVPRSLTCHVQEVNPADRQSPATTGRQWFTLAEVVENLIDQSSLDTYATPFQKTATNPQKPTYQVLINAAFTPEVLQSPLRIGLTRYAAVNLVKALSGLLTTGPQKGKYVRFSQLRSLQNFLNDYSQSPKEDKEAARIANEAGRILYA